MTFPYKWFRFPFAVAGDLTTIPDPTQGDGSISYDQGFGPDYQLDPATNPSALDIPRQQTNQLFNDITTALQYIQTGVAPAWIDATTNGGTAYSYPIGAHVLYTDGFVYESYVAANTATPGPGSNSWARVRTRLANNKTYTIAASGGDFTTMQAAIDYTKNNLDLNGYTLSLLYAAGSFTDSFSVKGTWLGQKDHTSVVIG